MNELRYRRFRAVATKDGRCLGESEGFLQEMAEWACNVIRTIDREARIDIRRIEEELPDESDD